MPAVYPSLFPVPSPPVNPASPVLDRVRIDAIDAARGFALLGIFAVNIALFARPLGDMIDHYQTGGTPTDRAVIIAVNALAMGKFYGLFSLLFGIGFALQRGRVVAAGGRWVPTYLRRLLFLGIVGLLHALLLWYGDILFIYAIAALVLLCFGWAGARGLAISGITMLAIVCVLMTGFGALTFLDDGRAKTQPDATANVAGPAAAIPQSDPAPGATTPDPAPDSPPMQDSESEPASDPADAAEQPAPPPAAAAKEPPADKPFWHTPFGRLIWGYKTQQIQGGPEHPTWRTNETIAYQQGPYSQVFLFRAMTWLSMLIFVIFMGFGFSILGMFFLGAALAKADAFSPARRPLHRKLLAAGFGLGLPLCVTGAVAQGLAPSASTITLNAFCQSLGAPLLSLGYLAAITMLVNSGAASWLTRRLALAGRMAFTNYLTQTVVATTIFYYYGMGLFGTTTRLQEIAIVFGIYAVQLFVISPLWMSAFRFGPLEWLWRSFTYLKAQPLHRARQA